MDAEAVAGPMRPVVTFIVVLTLCYLAMRWIPRWITQCPFVGPDVLRERLERTEDEVIVIDVRTEGEFLGPKGHVPGAINLPLGRLWAQLKDVREELEVHKNDPLFVTCSGEARATRAARMFLKLGFSDVSVLKGGMGAWKRAGYPVEGRLQGTP